ncbi:MAG TPA: biopolymer transporter ExbD [Gemmatimonadaceae bacterium]|jgi:biopolymer transport protein ExbD|nr:biopolymer transporter ExbD [Gemmatimonadaceae bacterium]
MAGMATGTEGLRNEPNVVPMIDVLLVLLIIFMITIPITRVAIDLQLPDPKPSDQPPPKNPDQIVLEVMPGGVFMINKEPVAREALAARIKEIYDPRPEKILFVKGDPQVTYQEVIWSMDVARGSGVRVIGIPPKDTK